MTQLAQIKAMLDAIPVSALSYQEWVDVGMALHSEGLPCSLWDDWSRNDTRYHQGECDRKWRTFGRSTDNIVTIGTLYHMAKEFGWTSAQSMRACGLDDWITTDEEKHSGWHHEDTNQTLPALPEDYSPLRDVTDYLSTLFEPEEKVCVVITACQDDEGKWRPYGGATSRTCKQLLDSLKLHTDTPIADTFGTLNLESGAWICFNPMDGTGRKNSNVTSYRYALVESDTQDIDTQYAILQDLKLPIKMLVHSGGKSLHAIVHIGAVDYKQYQERVDYLYTVCRKHGLVVDTQDKNPSRLSRFPGFKREGNWQYIVDRNIGFSDFVEWQHYIEDEMVEPLNVVSMAEVYDDPPPLKPVLIDGILRQGHKMLLVSSSKAGKTFSLIELAIAIAEGRRWLGFRCKQGRVLYLNMELDEASFDDRVIRVYEALEIEHKHLENIHIVHLRGQIEKLDKLVPQINRILKGQEYVAVILDPTYKLGIGDENAAEAVVQFTNAIDKIANSGVSVIYAHHHSKGQQGAKSSMDRASGSGVFARDADALLDMIELRIPADRKEEAEAEYGEKCTAWKLDATLREFQRIEPVNVFFSYPLHEVDSGGILDDANLEENERSMENGREIGNLAKKIKKQFSKEQLAEAIQRDEEISGKRKTQKQYADEFGVSDRTIRAYMRELEE